MTLAEFVLARIAEDEAQTRSMCKATPEDDAWMDDPPSGEPSARMLAEWEAKRQILKQYREEAEDLDNRRESDPGDPDDRARTARVKTLLEAVSLLALPYADHPDYRQEWRP